MAELVSYALTTVADVKESLGIPSSDTSKDNLIIRKINQATAMIENYTGRRFALTTYTNEEYDATHTDQIVLRQRPVTSVSSFGSRDTNLNEADWSNVDSNLFFVNSQSGILELNFNSTGHWNKLRITYTAGYATIPFDIAEAASTLAAYLVEHSGAGGAGQVGSIKSKSEGQRKVEYYETGTNKQQSQNTSSGLLDQLNLTEILAPYCNYPVLADK